MEQGRIIAGKYRLGHLLGRGGMAVVWSATHLFTERKFAIKFLLPQLARTTEASRRFLLEAKISARINHPNVIEVIDVDRAEDGSLFLVMELLHGASLDVVLRGKRPLLRDFLLGMGDVARGLAAAHRSGVIHRDLKPSNIFLHEDRAGCVVPKVLDFGVSKILHQASEPGLTVSGTILGSPLYMSPEQALGADDIDGRTDVFAFGAILFEALCGQRAYAGTSLGSLIVAIATTRPKSIDELAPELPEPLRVLVRECMIPDRAKRLASFERIAERLDAVAVALRPSVLRLPRRVDGGSPTGSDSIPCPSAPDLSLRSPASARPPSPSVPPHTFPTPRPTLPRRRETEHGLRGSKRERSLAPGAGRAPRNAVMAATLVMLLGGLGATFFTLGRTGPAAPTPTQVLARLRSSSLPAGAAQTERALPSAAQPNSVPLVTIDSLPTSAPSGTPQSRTGRLSVASMPVECSISIDGTARGGTPLAGQELAIGMHRIDCKPAEGSPRTASVTISPGSETHYQFILTE
jgi:serine/threonine-protein kinase